MLVRTEKLCQGRKLARPFIIMTPQTHRRLLCSALILLATFAARTTTWAAAAAAPSVDEVIAKARAALGPEDKLNGVVTLRLTGNILDATTQTTTPVILLFKKPSNQRLEVHNADGSGLVRATDGMAGWAVRTDKDGLQQLALIGPPQLDDFIYGGLENMYFYRAASRVIGASTTVEGPLQYHDAKCWRLSTAYPQSLTFIRYIDTTNGQLRGTEITADHTTSIEAGRITEGGINFPEEVRTFDQDNKLTQTLKISKVEINQPVEDKVFDVPLLTSLHTTPPASGNNASSASTGSLAPGGLAPLPALPPLNPTAPASTAPASGNQIIELPTLKK
jgi:outer membrane lipoprotein-sorting protein